MLVINNEGFKLFIIWLTSPEYWNSLFCAVRATDQQWSQFLADINRCLADQLSAKLSELVCDKFGINSDGVPLDCDVLLKKHEQTVERLQEARRILYKPVGELCRRMVDNSPIPNTRAAEGTISAIAIQRIELELALS